ncbi:TPA: 50S ribosomal protein L6 [Candidatus Uhrbacteria bacterium]|nr:MAG: 50S ribosomal protein L6 [Parcubacteria group bacterium GW2011_GWA2_53_21]HBL39435.1 50S ribosomal protein L6 [Candidatus Uhrbacteria bacterium]
MSRVGKALIPLPQGVEIRLDLPRVTVKGPKGELSMVLHKDIRLTEEEEGGRRVLKVSLDDPTDLTAHAQWGTTRALVANTVEGVSQGFSKILEVVGVGYKINLRGKTLVMSAGYSHEVSFELPDGVSAVVENNVVTLSGPDKQLIGEAAARIRKIRKPEPYKGKGIKYAGEAIRRKAGKTAKTGE